MDPAKAELAAAQAALRILMVLQIAGVDLCDMKAVEMALDADPEAISTLERQIILDVVRDDDALCELLASRRH